LSKPCSLRAAGKFSGCVIRIDCGTVALTNASNESYPTTFNIAATSFAFGPMCRFTNRSVHAKGRNFIAPLEASFNSVVALVSSGVKVISAIKRGEGMARTPRGKQKMLDRLTCIAHGKKLVEIIR